MFDNNRQPSEMDVTGGGVPIQMSELEAVVKQMKKEKAIGDDGVAV